MQEAGAAIQNKIGQFTANPLVRNIIGQPKSTFDMRKVMDDQKIVIINLSKGRVGEQNANLLGSMLITRIYLSAMSRADASESVLKNLPNFYLYVDEFQSFANESFADILSEARKYKLNLTIAHQYIDQMSEEVRSAVFGNVGTMITFRVGAYDAEVLEKEFAPVFTAEDLVNLGAFQIYLKLMIDGVTSQPFSATTQPPIPKPEISYRDDVIEHSRASFARPKLDVEKEIRAWHEEGQSGEKTPQAKNQHTFHQGNKTTHHEQRNERKPFKDQKEIKKEKKEVFNAIIAEEKKEMDRIAPKISLKDLRGQNKVDRDAKPAHVNELKKALEALIPKKGEVKEKIPASPTEKSSQKEEKPQADETRKTSKSSPHEIPEDELRRLLEVDIES